MLYNVGAEQRTSVVSTIGADGRPVVTVTGLLEDTRGKQHRHAKVDNATGNGRCAARRAQQGRRARRQRRDGALDCARCLVLRTAMLPAPSRG